MRNFDLKYIPFGLLIIFVIKSLIIGAGINEVLLIGILASLIGFYESKISHRRFQELQKEINDKIKDVKEHNNIQDKKIEDLQSSNLSAKLSTSLRGLTK